ncbi:MAG: hypothetical protein AAB443_03525 [Patescibacteria group bacterium]
MKSIKQILEEKGINRNYRNSFEHQAYGNALAEELGDLKHRALYIKYAKTVDRRLLEIAREFIRGVEKLKSGSKARLFMWKLKTLKDGKIKNKPVN